MRNTKIEYLYCDASNYKVSNRAVLSGEISQEQISAIFDSLSEGMYFIPSLVGLPEKKFSETDLELDHPFFCLEEGDISLTDDAPTVAIHVEEMVANFLKYSGKWDEEGAKMGNTFDGRILRKGVIHFKNFLPEKPDIAVEIDDCDWWEDFGGDSMNEIMADLRKATPGISGTELITQGCNLYFGEGNWRFVPPTDSK